MITSQLKIELPKFEGKELKPGITLVGEPTITSVDIKANCLANVNGALVVIQLSITQPLVKKLINERINP